MDLGDAPVPRLFNALVLDSPSKMTTQQIQDIVRRFAEAAQLLTQILSSKSNLPDDAYGLNEYSDPWVH
ncbi:hypothetical protein BDW59DRAFT_157134 [Aspergillus cavernicola]|uniref:Uncharacterized protein n=1 Tax=Aspergillus cavernicola TaxID=176166 RepID=A0ABR4IZC7_9EURO